MAASTAPLPGGGTLYMVRLLLAVRCSMTFTYLELSECWMMLSMVARTALLPGGGTLYKVRLLLAVRCSVTFTYLEVV
jgi:hypothetical protein